MTNWCSINGGLIQVPPLLFDRGLAYGHGLFESILLCNGQLPLLNRHLQRICRDASALSIHLSSKILGTCLERFCSALTKNGVADGIVKVIATAGEGGCGYKSPQLIEPNLVCSYSILPNDLDRQSHQGISVRCCNHRLSTNSKLAGIKHLNRLDQVLARLEWDCADYDEGLMFSAEGMLIEAVSANVFLRDNSDDWLTPELNSAGISGVMRSLLLEEIFPRVSMPAAVTNINIEDLYACQEMFVCNAVRGIVPVTAIYDSQGVLRKTLPRGQQTRILRVELMKNYSCYQ